MFNNKRKFSKIYDLHIEKIYRFVFLKVNSRETAEDITAEVFLRGWESFNNKEKNIENHSAFLYQIARNLIIDFYRQKGQIRLVSVENCKEIDDPNVDLQEEVALSSDMAEIKQFLDCLKDEYREVIILRYINDLTVFEVAKTLDKSETNVRVILHRALKALRKEMDNGRNA